MRSKCIVSPCIFVFQSFAGRIVYVLCDVPFVEQCLPGMLVHRNNRIRRNLQTFHDINTILKTVDVKKCTNKPAACLSNLRHPLFFNGGTLVLEVCNMRNILIFNIRAYRWIFFRVFV